MFLGAPGEQAAVAELVKAARARGEDITGPEELLKSITVTTIQVPRVRTRTFESVLVRSGSGA